MKAEYYVTIAGEKKGPFGATELRQRFGQGELPSGSLYWRQDWTKWRRFDELSVDELLEMLGLTQAVAQTPSPNAGLSKWHLAGALAAAVLAGAGIAYGVRQKLDRAEKMAEARQTEMRKEMAETVEAVRKDSDARVERVRQTIVESTKAEQRLLQRQAMDQDARLLAGAAQQYFMESSDMVVAIGYDPRAGELSGPVTQYLHRIAPGYTAVPTQLKLEGVFSLEHPNAGPAQSYHEDGRPFAAPQ